MPSWRQRSPVSSLLADARYRAKKQGIPFTITKDDVSIPEYCPALGFKLEVGHGPKNTSPSLDRVDPMKGYVPGNVQIISHLANQMKNCGTPSQLRMIVKYIERHYMEKDTGITEDPIVNNVLSKHISRSRAGMLKYGMTTDDNPKTLIEWLVDAQEEAMDLAVYLEKVIQDIKRGETEST